MSAFSATLISNANPTDHVIVPACLPDLRSAPTLPGWQGPSDEGGNDVNDEVDEDLAMALHRYEVISAYLVSDLSRGRRAAFLKKLSDRFWPRPDGVLVQYSPETLRKWVRRHGQGGLHALRDAPKERPGCRVLSELVIKEACRLKKEVPERSVRKIIYMMEESGFVAKRSVRRTTLHRALKAKGLSARKLRPPEAMDLDRWQADFANELWQADMMAGPYLPDPERPGKLKQAKLHAFLDDASRLLLHGRFTFSERLPDLELVFRRAIQRWGVPRKVYFDNGKVFRADHVKSICAHLGIHAPIHTKPYRPMGHGKIEAFNRFCRNAFVAEVKASRIKTLDELNEAFIAWVEEEYNSRVHSELQMSPMARFLQDDDRRTFADEATIEQAFLFKELRTTDKCGEFGLLGIRYQVASPALHRRRVQVRYDPEALDEVEVWHQKKFVERARPLEIKRHRRASVPAPEAVLQDDERTDWLGHLVSKRRKRIEAPGAPEPSTRMADLEAFLDALRLNLDPEVFDEELAREYFDRFGPFPGQLASMIVNELLQTLSSDQHLSVYLDEIRARVRKGEAR